MKYPSRWIKGFDHQMKTNKQTRKQPQTPTTCFKIVLLSPWRKHVGPSNFVAKVKISHNISKQSNENKIISSMSYFCESIKLVRYQLSLALWMILVIMSFKLQVDNSVSKVTLEISWCCSRNCSRNCPQFHLQSNLNLYFSLSIFLTMAECCSRFSLQPLQLLENVKSCKYMRKLITFHG